MKIGARSIPFILGVMLRPALAPAQEPPAVTPMTVTAPETEARRPQPRLHAFLDELGRDRGLVNAEAKAKRLDKRDARQARRELDALERKAREAARKTKDLTADAERSLQTELNGIGERIRDLRR